MIRKIYDEYRKHYSDDIAAKLTIAHAIHELANGSPAGKPKKLPRYKIRYQGVEIANSGCDSLEEAETRIEEIIRERWEYRVTKRDEYEIVETK